MTVLIRISMLLVALAAFALSFATLVALAELAGYGRLPWLYPVTLDLARWTWARWQAVRPG